jgi:hypothetical protein
MKTMQHGTSLVVTTAPPADWDRWVEQSAPTLKSNWIELASHRLTEGLVAFVARKHGRCGEYGELNAAVAGTVLSHAGSNPRLDPYRMLSGDSRRDGLLADGPHPWSGRSEDVLFPCLHLMLPNYETTVIGPRRHDADVLEAFCADIERWAQDQGCRSMAFSYLLPDPPALTDVLHRRGWFVATMTHRCDLAVTWDDFDGYLSTLPSRRRVAIRRELRDLASNGVTVESVPISDCDIGELIDLRLQLLEKYGQPGDAAREREVLQRLMDHFDGDYLTVFAARADDRVVGFTLMVRDGITWVALMTGTDYTSTTSSYCYFATCYYEPARLAPKLGIATISYGMGSWAAKRNRGCRLNPLFIAATSFASSP